MADQAVVHDDTEKRRSARANKKARVRAPQMFKHFKPESKTAKVIVSLGQSDLIRGAVQIVKKGEGDNNLHIHTGMDGFWMVLKGRVKFYGPDDKVLGEFGPHEGIVMPRGNAYWFASTGDEDLEILQVVAFDRDVKNERIDLDPQKDDVGPGKAEFFDGRVR